MGTCILEMIFVPDGAPYDGTLYPLDILTCDVLAHAIVLCLSYLQSPRSSLALSLQHQQRSAEQWGSMHTRAQSQKKSTSKSPSKMQNDLDRGWLMLFFPAPHSMCSYLPCRVRSLGNEANITHDFSSEVQYSTSANKTLDCYFGVKGQSSSPIV